MWPELPSDLLELITSRLDFPDSLRFGSVCAAWRSAASEQRRRRHPGGPVPLQIPLLLVHRAAPRGLKLGFLSIVGKRFLDLDLPESFPAVSRCCGAAWGWLVMVNDAEFDICLLNPVSRAQIYLPSRTHFPFHPTHAVSGGRRQSVLFRYVKKAVLSSDPSCDACTVAVIGRFKMLALFRPAGGGVRWSIFQGEFGGGYEDVAFHGDQLCALDFRGKLTIFSLGATAPSVTNFALVDPWADIGGQPGGSNYRHPQRHLVGSSRELLMVVREYYATAKNPCTAMSVRVFRLGIGRWEQVWSLGDRMLFVGNISSESFSGTGVGVVSGFIPNSICFIENLVERAACGLFSLESRYFYSIAVTEHLLLEEPAWVMPCLR